MLSRSTACSFYRVPQHESCNDIAADAGLLFDKTPVIRDAIMGTSVFLGRDS